MTALTVTFAPSDRAFALRLAGDLAYAGLTVTLNGETPVDFVVVCLSSALARTSSVGAVIEVAQTQHIPLVLVILEPDYEAISQNETLGWLLEKSLIHFEHSYPSGLTNLLKTLASERLFLGVDNPFVGCRAFTEIESPLFFGRDDTVRAALQRLRQTSFLTIVGTSGSGKSSLVQAGLIPQLRAGAIDGSAEWTILPMVADAHPIEALAGSLYPLLDKVMSFNLLVADLQVPSRVLPLFELIQQEAKLPAHLLLIIDQLESLFAQTSETERLQFLDVLRILTTFEESQTRLVLSLRSDFFTQVQQYPELAKLFEQDHLLVMPEMSESALRDAVERPLQLVDAQFDSQWVETSLQIAQKAPDSLPLLQTALHTNFVQRSDPIFETSIDAQAEKIFATLSVSEQEATQQALLNLVDISEGGDWLPRVVWRDEFILASTLVEKWAAPEIGLLVEEQHVRSETLTTRIRLSHAAWLSQWVRLRGWIEAQADEVQYASTLRKTAANWSANDQDKAYLLRGAALQQAIAWADQTTPTTLQIEFIQASLDDQNTRDRAERTRRVQDQLRRLHQQRVLLFTGVLLIFILVGLIASASSQ